MALGSLGGHLRSNSPPGWIVLGGAYDKLRVLNYIPKLGAAVTSSPG
jgi:hypothetical protein